MAEVRESEATPEALSHMLKEIVSRVHHSVGHRPARVLLARPGTIPKTSSGKIQRSRLVQMIVADGLCEQIVYSSGAHHA